MWRAVRDAPGPLSTPSHLVSHYIINRFIDCMEPSASFFLFFYFFVSGCRLSLVGTFHSLHLPTHAHVHMEGEISGHSPSATALPRNLSQSPKGPRCRWRWQPKCVGDSVGEGQAEDTWMPLRTMPAQAAAPDQPTGKAGTSQPSQPSLT